MVPEAPLEPTDASLVPTGEGWFVVNDFLVSGGECLLLIEGEERALQAWDFVHCPPWTEHVFVGAGEGPCVIVSVGTRTGGRVVDPVSELAQRHGAGVEQEAHDGKTAYAQSARHVETPYRKDWLPDF